MDAEWIFAFIGWYFAAAVTVFLFYSADGRHSAADQFALLSSCLEGCTDGKAPAARRMERGHSVDGSDLNRQDVAGGEESVGPVSASGLRGLRFQGSGVPRFALVPPGRF